MAAGEKKVNMNFKDVFEEGPKRIHVITDPRFYPPQQTQFTLSNSNVSVVREQYCMCTKNQTPRERRLLIACLVFGIIIIGLIIAIIILVSTNKEAARRLKQILNI